MTDACGLEGDGDGRFRLTGRISFETVTMLLSRDSELLDAPGLISIDLSGVTEFDSAGLALLLRWLGVARSYGREISFDNVPDKLTALATISDLEELIARK